MSTNKIYIMVEFISVSDDGNDYISYWADVTEIIKAIMGPDVKEAYIKLYECDRYDEPDAKQIVEEELAWILSKHKENPYTLCCDAKTVTVTLNNGHTFSFTNSEWGHIQETGQPEFE